MSSLVVTSYARASRSAFGVGALARALTRWAMMGLGLLLMAFSVLIAPLPGPLGVPFMVAGMALILRNSRLAKRMFVRAQRRHPKVFFPLRRLMRPKPEVAPVAWQAVLRAERFVLGRKSRILRGLRRRRARA